MRDEWVLIGVPTSAGAHHAGQERAPSALRAAGLIGRLRSAGVNVTDAGDLPGAVFAVDHDHPRARNLASVVAVARTVADAVERAARAGRRLLVVGGDCTITIGVIAGFRRVAGDVCLAYVDADADLGPGLSGEGSGILDATGVGHLLGHGEPALAGLDGSPPLLEPSRLALLGLDPRELSDEGRLFLSGRGVSFAEAAEFMADPEAAARQALAVLTGSARPGSARPGSARPGSARPGAVLAGPGGPMVVHFDVDVVDSGDLPLGNFPHYNSGVRLDAVGACLRVLLADPSCAALVLTEVNPTYDPDGSQLHRYIETLVTAVAE